MSRLRSTLSATPIDKAIQAQVAVAARAIRQALDACIAQGKSGDYAPAYVARVRRDLQGALGAVERVRRVQPRFDVDDPDFQPTSPYERPLKPEIASTLKPEAAPAAPPEVIPEEDDGP